MIAMCSECGATVACYTPFDVIAACRDHELDEHRDRYGTIVWHDLQVYERALGVSD